MIIWEKIEPELRELSIKTDSLSEILLSDNETIIPHLLQNLEVDEVKKALKKSVGLMVFEDYSDADIIEINDSYVIVECDAKYLAFSTNPFSSLESFRIRNSSMGEKLGNGIGFIEPGNPLFIDAENTLSNAIDAKTIINLLVLSELKI
jgi:hypothetical protein